MNKISISRLISRIVIAGLLAYGAWYSLFSTSMWIQKRAFTAGLGLFPDGPPMAVGVAISSTSLVGLGIMGAIFVCALVSRSKPMSFERLKRRWVYSIKGRSDVDNITMLAVLQPATWWSFSSEPDLVWVKFNSALKHQIRGGESFAILASAREFARNHAMSQGDVYVLLDEDLHPGGYIPRAKWWRLFTQPPRLVAKWR